MRVEHFDDGPMRIRHFLDVCNDLNVASGFSLQTSDCARITIPRECRTQRILLPAQLIDAILLAISAHALSDKGIDRY